MERMVFSWSKSSGWCVVNYDLGAYHNEHRVIIEWRCDSPNGRAEETETSTSRFEEASMSWGNKIWLGVILAISISGFAKADNQQDILNEALDTCMDDARGVAEFCLGEGPYSAVFCTGRLGGLAGATGFGLCMANLRKDINNCMSTNPGAQLTGDNMELYQYYQQPGGIRTLVPATPLNHFDLARSVRWRNAVAPVKVARPFCHKAEMPSLGSYQSFFSRH